MLCLPSALAIAHLAQDLHPVRNKVNDEAAVGLDTSPPFAIPVTHLHPDAHLPSVYELGRNDGQHLANAANRKPIDATLVGESNCKDDEEDSEEDTGYEDEEDKDDEDDEDEDWDDEDEDEEYEDQVEDDNVEKEDDESDTTEDSDADARNPAWDDNLARRIARLKGYRPSDIKKPTIDTIIDMMARVPVRHDIRPDRAVDPCAVVSRYGSKPIPYEAVKACLDSDFPFPSNHRAETAATVKSLIANFYVYEDLAANPPSGEQRLSFLPVNIRENVDRLLQVSDNSIKAADSADDGEDDESDDQEGRASVNSQALEALATGFGDILDKPDIADIAAANKMTDRAFHDGLSRILAKARDGHLSYDADCFRAFRWQQGFFMNHVVRDNKVVLKVHSVTPNLAEATGLQQDLLNCDVVSIDGQNAVEYIQSWADAQVSMSKDTNVRYAEGLVYCVLEPRRQQDSLYSFTLFFLLRFNAALASPQYRPGFVDFFIPGKFGERYSLPAESSLSFVFKCPGQLPIKTNVKWLGFYTRLQSKPFQDTKSYFAINCMSQDGLTYDRDEFNPIRSKIEQEEIKEEERTILELRTRLRDKVSHPNTKIDGLSDIPTDSPPKTAQDGPVDHSRQEIPTPQDTLKPQTVEEILSQLDMLTAEKLPVVKFYDDFGGRPSELSQSSSGANFKELYKGAHDITASKRSLLPVCSCNHILTWLTLSSPVLENSPAGRRRNGCHHRSYRDIYRARRSLLQSPSSLGRRTDPSHRRASPSRQELDPGPLTQHGRLCLFGSDHDPALFPRPPTYSHQHQTLTSGHTDDDRWRTGHGSLCQLLRQTDRPGIRGWILFAHDSAPLQERDFYRLFVGSMCDCRSVRLKCGSRNGSQTSSCLDCWINN